MEQRFTRINTDLLKKNNLCKFALIVISFLSLTFPVAAQKLAVLVPEKTAQTKQFAEKLETSLSPNFKILDDSLSEIAFLSAKHEKPFNLSLEEAKNVGAAIGCDYFLLIKAENLVRYSFERKEYQESYAAVYAISSRTGRLIFWKLAGGEAENAEKADGKLFALINDLAAEISDKLKSTTKEELNEKPAPKLEELPAEDSPEAKNFRPPLPYRSIKPSYTRTAYLYSVEATVDIEIDVDENGKILRTKIVRWAGFGLDESVTETVRKMNWRPASRNGKPLPMRVLLRYNFKKTKPDDEQ
ncbi:MAG: TonB family protein [Acidobacteria bacterium]|nr:TonB family protein [Acidobacteriota bacterium]